MKFTSFLPNSLSWVPNKKERPNCPKLILRQLGRLVKRPAAFRLLLTEDLALSGSKIIKATRMYIPLAEVTLEPSGTLLSSFTPKG
jgi:hypothetical protein